MNQLSQFRSTQAASATTEQPVLEQIEKIKDAFDPTSASCQFKAIFYNNVGKAQTLLYDRPSHMDPVMYEAAVRDRPSDGHVPVLAVGFSDLEKRAQVQKQAIMIFRNQLHEANEKVEKIMKTHDLETLMKIKLAKKRMAELEKKVGKVARMVQVLKYSGFVMRPEEEKWKRDISNLLEKVEDPAVVGRINEVWARLSKLKFEREQIMKNGLSAGNDSSLDLDEQEVEKLAKILKEQQDGIVYLSEILQTDRAKLDAAIVKRQ